MASARADAREARELGEQARNDMVIAWADHMLGEAHLRERNWAQAIEALERSTESVPGVSVIALARLVI